MNNFENIKPYADFAHKVAPYGGPEQYLEAYGNARYECGKEEQKGQDMWIMVFGMVATLLACATAEWGIHKYNEVKKKQAEKKAEQAKDAYLNAVLESDDCTELEHTDMKRSK